MVSDNILFHSQLIKNSSLKTRDLRLIVSSFEEAKMKSVWNSRDVTIESNRRTLSIELFFSTKHF